MVVVRLQVTAARRTARVRYPRADVVAAAAVVVVRLQVPARPAAATPPGRTPDVTSAAVVVVVNDVAAGVAVTADIPPAHPAAPPVTAVAGAVIGRPAEFLVRLADALARLAEAAARTHVAAAAAVVVVRLQVTAARRTARVRYPRADVVAAAAVVVVRLQVPARPAAATPPGRTPDVTSAAVVVVVNDVAAGVVVPTDVPVADPAAPPVAAVPGTVDGRPAPGLVGLADAASGHAGASARTGVAATATVAVVCLQVSTIRRATGIGGPRAHPVTGAAVVGIRLQVLAGGSATRVGAAIDVTAAAIGVVVDDVPTGVVVPADVPVADPTAPPVAAIPWTVDGGATPRLVGSALTGPVLAGAAARAGVVAGATVAVVPLQVAAAARAAGVRPGRADVATAATVGIVVLEVLAGEAAAGVGPTADVTAAAVVVVVPDAAAAVAVTGPAVALIIATDIPPGAVAPAVRAAAAVGGARVAAGVGGGAPGLVPGALGLGLVGPAAEGQGHEDEQESQSPAHGFPSGLVYPVPPDCRSRCSWISRNRRVVRSGGMGKLTLKRKRWRESRSSRGIGRALQ